MVAVGAAALGVAVGAAVAVAETEAVAAAEAAAAADSENTRFLANEERDAAANCVSFLFAKLQARIFTQSPHAAHAE